MFKKILCPIDGSDHARKALDLAIDLAKAGKAELVLLHALLATADSAEMQRFAEVEGLAKAVQPEIKRLSAVEGRLEYGYTEQPAPSRALVEIGQHILDGAKLDAEEGGVKTVTSLLVGGDVAKQILRCIEERDIDCVVMGARGLSETRALFLGSVSHKVANQAPCTCIAVK